MRNLVEELRGIRLGVVRRMLGEYLIEESCKEFVWRNVRYSIELVVVRRMLGEM